MNDLIIDMLNEGKEETVIIYHLFDNYNLTLQQARFELDKAKKWGSWYAHKSNKEEFINNIN